MVNRMEKVKQSLKNHYVLSDKIFNDIKNLGKQILTIDKKNVKNNKLVNNNSFISDIFGNLSIKVELTNEITSNLEKIILGDKNQIIEDPFEDFTINDLNNTSHSLKNIYLKNSFSQSDEINLFESNQEFILNYHFNVLLVFLLGLEMLINLIYNIKLNNIESNYLNKILTLCLDNYINLTWYFNENFKNLGILDIPKDFPKSLTQENLNTFTLLFSELKIEIKYFKSNSYNSMENAGVNNKKNKINSDFNRKYSTLISRSNNLVRNFSTSRITNSDKNILPKDINYNKSIFSVLEKIKEFTSTKSYNTRKLNYM
jgi:hypothetical protein